ncbi:MAG: GNAT family N-acetyltransferase [Thiotrichaceae bacterium]|nr:GNAT family N-acetyltransferase [Thiotrichaceae bacterium]
MTLDSFQLATAADVEFLAALINAAYRPENSNTAWTHESALVTGARINARQLLEIILKSDTVILIASAQQQRLACVQIEKKLGQCCYIGTLAVNPTMQMAGLGKQILNYAEHYARTQFGAQKLVMSVLSARAELIAFYLRRGYRQTGELLEYPITSGVGIPKQSGLKLEVLEKLA